MEQMEREAMLSTEDGRCDEGDRYRNPSCDGKETWIQEPVALSV